MGPKITGNICSLTRADRNALHVTSGPMPPVSPKLIPMKGQAILSCFLLIHTGLMPQNTNVDIFSYIPSSSRLSSSLCMSKMMQKPLSFPKKHLSQHYLCHPHDAQRIAHALEEPHEKILEIGAGKGALTHALLSLPCKEVHAIEKDEENVRYLRQRFEKEKTLTIHQGDALDMDWNDVSQRSFALIGNWPYHIGSALMLRLLAYRACIAEAVCMVQKEVGERWCSKEKSKYYGRLSVLIQSFYEVKRCFVLPPTSFYPIPKVYSLVLHLKRYRSALPYGIDFEKYALLIRTAFGQRRKMLKKALAGYADMDLSPFSTARAEELSPHDYIYLARRYFCKTIP